MYYAIISEDVDNSLALRQQARPAHLERLQALRDEGPPACCPVLTRQSIPPIRVKRALPAVL